MVLADGTFDPLHIGHVKYLEAAFDQRQFLCGEGLAVRIAPDTAVSAKGRKPFQIASERADTVSAIVECQCYFNATLAGAIRELKPRVLVKGIDWMGRLPDDVLSACVETKTAVMFVQTQERTSTERLRA